MQKRIGVEYPVFCPEPLGGAQMDPGLAVRTAGVAIHKALHELRRLKSDDLVRRRMARLMALGRFSER